MSLTEEEKLKRVSGMLESDEGKIALSDAMIEPIRRILTYSDIDGKVFKKIVIYNGDKKSILCNGKYFIFNEMGSKRI